ncbi:MAG: hypothetical protein AABX93_03925 [Nanoarchaeota archaeon]
MEIKEEIVLSVSHYGPVGSRIRCPRINDQNYEILFANLRSAGILMDLQLSEKTLRYYVGNAVRESTIPIETSLPSYSRESLQSYALRDGKNLELILRNWNHNSTPKREGVIGGTVSGEYGIVGNLTLNVSNLDPEIINHIRKSLEETYMKKFR